MLSHNFCLLLSLSTISFIKIFSLCLTKFLILRTLRLIILFLRYLLYLTVLYLLSMFLVSNMSHIDSVFDVNVSYIVNNSLNDVRSFSIFSNNSVHLDVLLNLQLLNLQILWSINTCEYVETLRLYYDLVLLLISKL